MEHVERVTKRSISIPATLAREIQERTGTAAFSAVVTEALEHWLAMAKQRELVEAGLREAGPISDEARQWAEDVWSRSA